jgi:endonuclease/exonuclease/phosphatase family metal-dependent hydrolase
VLPFLKREKPDIVALQEVMEADIPQFERALGAESVFIKNSNSWDLFRGNPPKLVESIKGAFGVAVFSRHPILTTDIFMYAEHDEFLELQFQKAGFDKGSIQRGLITIVIRVEGQIYSFATTHFNWTPDGSTSDEQIVCMKKLLQHVQELGPCVMAGDFNAPRGKEVFSMITTIMKDNIPPETTTTLDQEIHGVKGLQFVVDGMFSQPPYIVSNVRVVSGVSDHCALVGEVTRS